MSQNEKGKTDNAPITLVGGKKQNEIGEAMYGVVLWSDSVKNCAVIWCEDHRKLAYFSKSTDASAPDMSFGVGDLVEFDIREEDDLRLALAPVVVAERHHTLLSDDLLRTVAPEAANARAQTSLPSTAPTQSRVLPFPGPSVAPVDAPERRPFAGQSRPGALNAPAEKPTDRKYG